MNPNFLPLAAAVIAFMGTSIIINVAATLVMSGQPPSPAVWIVSMAVSGVAAVLAFQWVHRWNAGR